MYALDRQSRPVVSFDPSNVQHRALYQTFLKTNRWDHSPVRFDLDDNYLELPHYLNTLIVQWYMSQDKKLVNLNSK